MSFSDWVQHGDEFYDWFTSYEQQRNRRVSPYYSELEETDEDLIRTCRKAGEALKVFRNLPHDGDSDSDNDMSKCLSCAWNDDGFNVSTSKFTRAYANKLVSEWV